MNVNSCAYIDIQETQKCGIFKRDSTPEQGSQNKYGMLFINLNWAGSGHLETQVNQNPKDLGDKGKDRKSSKSWNHLVQYFVKKQKQTF